MNVAVKDSPTRNSVDQTCSYARMRLERMKNTMIKLHKKINSLEHYVKTKDCALIDAHTRISFMSGFLSFAKDIANYPKEEEESKQVEEIKMLNYIANDSSINLDTCTLHELLTMLQNMLMVPLLICIKKVLDLILLIL